MSFNTHKVPASTFEAIKKAQEKGVKIFVATGRPKGVLYRGNNINEIDFDGYATMNGQYCYTKDGEVLYKKHLERKDMEDLVKFLEKKNFPCIFFEEEEIYINYIDEKVEKLMKDVNLELPDTKDIKRVIENDIYQLNPYVDNQLEKELMEVLPNCEATRWSPLFIDVIPKNGGKHKAIEKLIEYYGYTKEEVMAFGDGGNDKSMIEYVGIGVAMGNAVEELKNVADYITDTVDNDGIMKALKHFKVID